MHSTQAPPGERTADGISTHLERSRQHLRDETAFGRILPISSTPLRSDLQLSPAPPGVAELFVSRGGGQRSAPRLQPRLDRFPSALDSGPYSPPRGLLTGLPREFFCCAGLIVHYDFDSRQGGSVVSHAPLGAQCTMETRASVCVCVHGCPAQFPGLRLHGMTHQSRCELRECSLS